MPSIQDDRGYNQGYKESKSVEVRTDRRCDYMVSMMEKNQVSKILEIGCGTGRHAFTIARKTGKAVVGTDICRAFIEKARETYVLPNLDYRILDFNSQKDVDCVLGGQTYDYVIGDGILHHLYYNLGQSLGNIYKLLKTGGKIIFLEPSLLNPYCLMIFTIPFLRKAAKLEPAEMALTKGFITRKILAAGFKDVKVEYRDFLVPGVPDFMIKPIITVGDALEKIPVFKMLAQSLFISAVK